MNTDEISTEQNTEPLKQANVSNSADYEPFGIEWRKEVNKMSKAQIIELFRETGLERIAFEAKYDKCIKVINRFDAGIVGMYEL